MTARLSLNARIATQIIFALILVGCADNAPYRTANPGVSPAPFEECNVKYSEREHLDDCDQSYYATYRHQDKDGNYDFDLAFVEFTERGAVFDQERMEDVIKRVGEKAKLPHGVTTVVYVHGWKNNAAPDNGNVRSFRGLLAKTAQLQHKLANDAKRQGHANNDFHKRKLVGIYIGWRGASLQVQPFNQLSYWDRKAVAEEVGKGGVTELLLRLERMLRDDKKPNKNLYLVTGHSLGAAVLLTGLSEIFLERIIDKFGSKCGVDESNSFGHYVGKTDSFGHGVGLLNPAIETSEILELKQLAAQNCFHENQERLMHVISSDADTATTGIFNVAQWLGLVIGWNQARFERNFDEADHPILFDETKMDTTTIGNYAPFLTGYLFSKDSEKAEEYGVSNNCIVNPNSETWKYVPFKRREDCFREIFDDEVHVPIGDHEPVVFIKTDQGFIGDHNDVFNENVAAYLATIVAENRFIRAYEKKDVAAIWQTAYEGPPACHPKKKELANDEKWTFDFGQCFETYHREFCEITNRIDSSSKHESCGK